MKNVFISHNSQDKAFVRKLAAALTEYDISCWIDESEIKYGESLVRKISGAIEEIDIVIAVISKNSVSSGWVRQELDWAMTKEINNKKIVVIPVIIDRIDIPFFLANKFYADFTNDKKFRGTVVRLAEAVRFHEGKAVSPETENPAFGESIHLRYNPTYIPFLISSGIIVFSILAFMAAYFFSGSGHSLDSFEIIKNHIYTFFTLVIATQLGEILRLLFIRYLIKIDPVFAYDCGLIRVTSLFFKRYRILVRKHWSKHLLKVCVLFEILITVAIVVMISYFLKIWFFRQFSGIL